MSLNNLKLKYSYRSSSDIIHEDFYKKCLMESTRYDRAVGYFTSGSLSLLAEGLEEFLFRDGTIRIVANPHLTKSDREAIQLGYKAREIVLIESLLKEIKLDKNTIENDPFNTLAWLIYNKQLEIKIAYPSNNGLYHEKFGTFYDEEENRVSFTGSANETIGGLKNNFEKIDVFFETSDTHRIDLMEEDFEKLWNNTTSNLEVIDLPEIVLDKIFEYKSDYPINKKNTKTNLNEPRGYQIDALEAIKENNWHGILDMATGTGKTFTSLIIANKFLEENDKIFLVIYAPFTHLIEQWIENLNKFGFNNAINCSGSKNSWTGKLQSEIRDYNLGLVKKSVAITTYSTGSSEIFNEMVSNIHQKGFLIADECHNFGANNMRHNKLAQMEGKLGLSATPSRWRDEAGTEYINNFFDGIVFEYSIGKAIKNDFLCAYNYYPLQTELNETEIEDYQKLTKKLIVLHNQNKDNSEEIQKLNIIRSRILDRAIDKKEKLFKIFEKKVKAEVSNTLIYCAPGEINIITKKLSEFNYRVSKFDSTVKMKDRKKILTAFSSGTIQILVAIRCLDEGVDVPSTRDAYFLSSTSNPRQFVQRRGRVLRKHQSKNLANIYDFVVLPRNGEENIFSSIAAKELPRFSEFSNHAINKYSARKEIGELLKPYHLEYLMDKLPWEVYEEFKNKF